MLAALYLVARQEVEAPVGRPVGDLQARMTESQYVVMVERVLEHLRAGDIYQANVAQRFEVPWEGSGLALHAFLREQDPAQHSGWMRGPGWELCCNSPERLVSLRGAELLTEPIAGTDPLPQGGGLDEAGLNALIAGLEESAKDRAEHVMVVDIHRNDLGRVAAPGSVHVPAMMKVDRRRHVLQAVAEIRGRLAEGRDAVDVIEAMLPAGCITGVPKVRCMEILDDLEESRRGPYTGAFGWLATSGDLDLNVLIRSAWRIGEHLAFQAGGGIVLDSVPAREYQESLAKLKTLREAVESLQP